MKNNKTKTQHNPEKLAAYNVGYTRWRTTKQKHNTLYNINMTWVLLQTTGGKDKPKIGFVITLAYLDISLFLKYIQFTFVTDLISKCWNTFVTAPCIALWSIFQLLNIFFNKNIVLLSTGIISLTNQPNWKNEN